MKKVIVGLLILGCVILAIFLLKQPSRPQQQQVAQQLETIDTNDQETLVFPEPPPGAIVFDMKYRGLSGEKDELRYNSFWGFGGGAHDTPFIADLKKKVKNYEAVYNPCFGGMEWSAAELKDNKVVALYIDLNADGKVSDNEKILPIQNSEPSSYDRTEFVTPDFVMTTRDNHQVPFRALLQATFYGQSRPQFMWSPSCILEGTSTINNQPAKLILFTDFTGSFKDFGRSSYSLQIGKEQTGSHIPRDILSSIINHNGQFYNLKLYGSHEQDSRVRAVLEKYTGPTGELAVKLTGDTNLKAKLSRASVVGSKDNTIRFNVPSIRLNVPSSHAKLPIGVFKLNNSYMYYGEEKDNEWQLDFKEGPEFTIDANKTSNVEVGKPVLSIRAIDESKRYQSGVKEQTIYPEGTNIYISRIIKGKEGELYGRFSQKQQNSEYTDIEPELKIVDAEGKEVAAAKIKYG